jgi:hypothetical protein
MTPPSGLGGVSPRAGRPEAAGGDRRERGRGPEAQQLERDRPREAVDGLGRVGDDDEAVGGRGDDLLRCARRRRP